MSHKKASGLSIERDALDIIAEQKTEDAMAAAADARQSSALNPLTSLWSLSLFYLHESPFWYLCHGVLGFWGPSI